MESRFFLAPLELERRSRAGLMGRAGADGSTLGIADFLETLVARLSESLPAPWLW